MLKRISIYYVMLFRTKGGVLLNIEQHKFDTTTLYYNYIKSVVSGQPASPQVITSIENMVQLIKKKPIY